MDTAWEFIKDLMNPQSLIKLGLPLLLFVIFAETGLFAGFFLPGDSLVFISGLACATQPELLKVNFGLLLLLMTLSAILGNIFGYFFGLTMGKRLFKRKDSFLFKKRRLLATQEFYNQHGGKTLVIGRFLPIIRTFAPILAGILRINFQKFMLYNSVGAIAWIGSIASIGYFLGKRFPSVQNYLGYIVIGLIVVTAIPVIVTMIKEKRKTNI